MTKEEFQVIIDRLPKCWRLNETGNLVQDVPVVPGMRIWHYSKSGWLKCRTILSVRRGGNLRFQRMRVRHSSGCYSTPEAAAYNRRRGGNSYDTSVESRI